MDCLVVKDRRCHFAGIDRCRLRLDGLNRLDELNGRFRRLRQDRRSNFRDRRKDRLRFRFGTRRVRAFRLVVVNERDRFRLRRRCCRRRRRSCLRCLRLADGRDTRSRRVPGFRRRFLPAGRDEVCSWLRRSGPLGWLISLRLGFLGRVFFAARACGHESVSLKFASLHLS